MRKCRKEMSWSTTCSRMSVSSRAMRLRIWAEGTGMTSARGEGGRRSVLFVELPDGDVSVVAAGGQQSRLLRVPGHAVDVLTVSSGHLSNQREHRLVGIAGVFLKHTHAVIAAGGGQGAGQTAPETRRLAALKNLSSKCFVQQLRSFVVIFPH